MLRIENLKLSPGGGPSALRGVETEKLAELAEQNTCRLFGITGA